VDIAVDLLDADKSAVLAWDDGRERLVMRVARNFSKEAASRINFAPGEGFVGRVMATGELIAVEDAETDLRNVPERPEVVEAVLSDGVRSFMDIPIRLDDEIFGVFTVSYNQIRAFGAASSGSSLHWPSALPSPFKTRNISPPSSVARSNSG